MNKKYVQYGSGLSAPLEWDNFDVSPTLRIQKIPVIGRMLRSRLNTVFPDNVMYGDIIKGLPGVAIESCDGIYCSHVLEHLSLEELDIAIRNTFLALKKGGTFRCVVPDLEYSARKYIKSIDNNLTTANTVFLNETHLGVKSRPKGFMKKVIRAYQNSIHLWMWDRVSLKKYLEERGFRDVRECNFNDSSDTMFSLVENEERFKHAVAIEAKK